jgi:dTDP-glucose 4,6-dehydratase/UDP-glucuronate decarboxylase
MTVNSSVIAGDVESIVDDLEASLPALRSSTLLVTGARGFLCSYFIETAAALNDRGFHPPCRVIAVDNLRTGLGQRLAPLEKRPDITFLNHDVSRPLKLEGAADWIIHGASIASPTFYRKYPLQTIDANVWGTRHLLDLAREKSVRGMLYLSTSEIYGDPDPAFIPTSEDYRGNVSCTGPRACYDESKRLAETLCLTYVQVFDLPVSIIRPFNVYGPGQRLDDGRIIPDLMNAALHLQPLVLFSDGRSTRAFCYIADAVRAMWLVLLSRKKGAIYNVGNDEREIPVGELAKMMQSVAGPPLLKIQMEKSSDADYLTDCPARRCPDLRRLRMDFSWKPKVSLEEGLRRTLQFYREENRQA